MCKLRNQNKSDLLNALQRNNSIIRKNAGLLMKFTPVLDARVEKLP